MKHIFVNFKRFDVPSEMGGVNRIAPISDYSSTIVNAVKSELADYGDVEFVQYYPEAQIKDAIKSAEGSVLRIGCQGVYRSDVSVGGNFGAFTTSRPASAMAAFGVKDTIIGHCEERRDLAEILSMGGCTDSSIVNKILNKEVLQAQSRGMNVLYCVGEKDTELDQWEEVISQQLRIGLEGADLSKVVIAYEPIWSIGPGKTPAGKEYIQKVARLIKSVLGDVDVVYGGGLKKDNAKMLSTIDEISGGLIALTQFSGEIGFYPEQYLEIIRLYLNKE